MTAPMHPKVIMAAIVAVLAQAGAVYAIDKSVVLVIAVLFSTVTTVVGVLGYLDRRIQHKVDNAMGMIIVKLDAANKRMDMLQDLFVAHRQNGDRDEG